MTMDSGVRKRRAAKSSAGKSGRGGISNRGGNGTSSVLRVAATVGVVLLLVGVWALMPRGRRRQAATAAGDERREAHAAAEPNMPGAGAPPSAEAKTKQQSLTGPPAVSCTENHDRAQRFLQQQQAQQAIDQLIECALKNEGHPGSHWNVGVLLKQVNDIENALSWMKAASDLHPTYVKYHKGIAYTQKQAGMLDAAVASYVRAMELLLRLDNGTWPRTLMYSADDAPEDLDWFVQEGPEVADLLEVLCQTYVKARWLPAANAAYKILSKTQPDNKALQARFADFSAGVGFIKQSIQVSLDSMVLQQSYYDPDGDAYGAVMEKSTLLLTATFYPYIVNLARNVLLSRARSELAMVADLCQHDIGRLYGRKTIGARDMIDLLGACLQEQAVIEYLLEKGADITAQNGFKFSSMHHAAALGHLGIAKALLDARADPSDKNSIDQNSLHVAVMCGYHEVIPLLISKGADVIQEDRWGRIPLEIACMHRWNWKKLHVALRTDYECSKEVLTPASVAPPARLAPGGGWLAPSGLSTVQPQCDFDMRENLTPLEFLVEYLSVQRPVLVRGAMKSALWKELRAKWAREAFVQAYGDVELPSVTIPYAGAYGLPENKTTVLQHVAIMTQQHVRAEQGQAVPEEPQYIFASLKQDHPMLDDVLVPGFLDPDETEILTMNTQFYLGPAGSGAPMHFHRGAWNALIHGRKRWLVQPPAVASYSTEHPASWAQRYATSGKANGTLMECVQESGDVLFIPEAWGHSVLNLAESVGYASEFEWGMTEFSV